ncbi:metallophosphoesterase [Peribacillus sp. SCS-155]|uniref:metallophosphoesterase n=1 Tax=Peribacillus sedimenti TaxID=3115297 RepID=UPI003906843F
MTTYYISDIHGYFDPFITLLSHVKFNPGSDRLIIGGDMINRGPDSAKVLEWVRENSAAYPDSIHVILGNHEEMMIWYMNNVSHIWLEHGGIQTIRSFNQIFGNGWEMAEDYAKWLETIPLLYVDDDAVYTHSGVSILHSYNQQPRNILWVERKELRSLDEEELSKWSNGKRIFRGHTPSSKVSAKGIFVHCDLGMGIFDSNTAGLALVDIKENKYFRFKHNGVITEHRIDKK